MGDPIMPREGWLQRTLYDTLVHMTQLPSWMVKLTDTMHSEWKQGTLSGQKKSAELKLETKIFSCNLSFNGELEHPPQVSVLGYDRRDAYNNARMVISSAYPNTYLSDWSIRNIKEITEKQQLPLNERLALVRHVNNLPLLGLDIK